MHRSFQKPRPAPGHRVATVIRGPLSALLVAPLLALAAVGCGVKASNDAGSASANAEAVVPTTEASDRGDDGGAQPAEPTDTTTGPGGGPETTAPDEMSTLPPGFDEEALKEQIALGFESAGLTPEQADCLAEAYVDEYGTDTSAAGDFDAIFEILAGCDVSPTDLAGGGDGG